MAGLVGPLRIGAWLFGSRGPAWPCAGGPGALLLLRRAPAVRASSSTAFTEAVKDHIGTGILTKADQSARRLAAHAAKREHFLRPPEPAPVYTGPSVSELFELELSDAVEPADADALRERALVGAGALTDAYEAQLLCEAVVVSLVRERRTEAAWDAFTAGRLHGITPTPAAYAAMIQACALDDEVERAERVVSDMQSAGIWPPPAACWDNLLFAYASRATALTRLTGVCEGGGGGCTVRALGLTRSRMSKLIVLN
ncbi:hypothetical protein T492DRAFT_383690 [Pavlovales sp. CCMP2436]|nr:hypothetical protein T492DRAFT_383690 [Pavlovales sp. CCMP2436]